MLYLLLDKIWLITQCQKKKLLTLSGSLFVCTIQQFQCFQLKHLAPHRYEEQGSWTVTLIQFKV